MKNDEFTITLGGRNGWSGLCPGWTENSYPFYGNKNQASAITDIDLRDPNVLKQGPGIANLTSGDHTGELGENLIVAILKHATSANVSYACSKDNVFKLSATAVLNGNFPLAITGGTYQVATDLIYYKSNVYVFWNDTGTEGEIAKVTIGTPAIDVDFGSTSPTGAAHLEDAPHYAIVGGDDIMYVTNGRYVAKYDGTTLTVQGLDFWTDAETISLSWNNNRVKIAMNRPNIAGSNFNQSGIYTWNGVSSSWEGDPIEVSGEIGALYTKNGITFVWWKDSISAGGYNFGYISGLQLKPLRRYSGSLPNQAQVGEYDGFIAWLSSQKLFLWGAKDTDIPVKLFPFMSAKHTTAIGGFATPFGTPFIASHQYATFTAVAATEIITSAAHGLADNDTVRLTTTNTLPAGLSTSTTYYVITSTTNTFQLSASEGGSAINITDTGTGVHTFNRYSLGKTENYSVSASYKSMAFDVSMPNFKSQIDLIQVETEQMSAGAKLDITMTYDQGKSTQSLTQVAYSTNNITRHKVLNRGYSLEDFRLDCSWKNGSVTNPVKVRKILISGHYTKSN